MSIEQGLLILVAMVTAASALGVVLSNSIVRSAISLLFTLVGVSLVYFLLGAEFLGAVQLIVYVGGTLVLVVFGGMLTSQGPYAVWRPIRLDWVLSVTLATLIMAAVVIIALDFSTPSSPSNRSLPGAGALGMGLLGISATPSATSYLLMFELVSVHLLVVLIGAAYLARAQRTYSENEHG